MGPFKGGANIAALRPQTSSPFTGGNLAYLKPSTNPTVTSGPFSAENIPMLKPGYEPPKASWLDDDMRGFLSEAAATMMGDPEEMYAEQGGGGGSGGGGGGGPGYAGGPGTNHSVTWNMRGPEFTPKGLI